MAEKRSVTRKLVGDKLPGEGMSYILPDGLWLTIPLGAKGEQVREVQAQFWLAWANHRQSSRSVNNSTQITPTSHQKR